MQIGARREDASLYVAKARQTMATVDAMPSDLRALVYDNGLTAVQEGIAFAGPDRAKLTGFLAKRRARRQAQALQVSITLV